MKIFPEQLRWFNEKELIDWLEGMRDSCKSTNDQSLIQYLIDHLDQMNNAEHTIEIHVKIDDPAPEDASKAAERKINHTCINCRYYEPDVKYCEKLESDDVEYNYECGYWKENKDEDY